MKKLPIVSQSTTTGAPGHHGRSAQPRQGLAQLLEFYGFLVEEARDGRAALTLLQCADSDIALLVLDLMLPGSVSGRDIRARMLTDPACADIPTIVVTAADIDAPGRAGLCPQAWLEKPFRFDQLLELAKRFVVPETEAGSIAQVQ